MKKCLFISFILIVTLSFSLNAQWTQSEQPTGGYSAAIAKVGTEIWNATNYGVYVSNNEGITWHRHATLLQPTIDIKVKGDTVIMLIQENPSAGVYHLSTMSSYDLGITWNSPVIVETDNSYYTWGDREIFVTDSSLVINNNSSTYYISLNFGQTWDSITIPASSFYISAYSTNYIVGYCSYGIEKGNYYSDNGGQSWNFLDSIHLASNAVIMDSTFIFLSYTYDTIQHFYIARTSDFGLTYDSIFVTNSGANSFKRFNGKLLYQIFPYPQPQPPFMYESSDTGSTWTLSAITDDMIWISDDNSILLSNWDWMVGVGTLGIFRYNPTSQTSYHTETGIRASDIVSLNETNGILYARSDNGKMFRSDNAGATFIELPSFINGYTGFEFIGDTILGFTRNGNSANNLAVSYDNGTTWDSIVPVSPQNWQNGAFIKYYHQKIYISSYTFMVSSSDWGTTWDTISEVVDVNCNINNIYSDRFVICNDELFLLNVGDQNVLKLDTISNTWINKLCYSAPGVTYEGLFSLENNLVLTAGGTFKYSADSGNTWTSPARIGFPSNARPYSLISKNGVWYATGIGKIYYSFNHGDNWQQLLTNVGMSVNAGEDPNFAFLNEIMYAGGNNIWWRDDTLRLVSGLVYYDTNNNSIKDTQEPVLPNHLLYSTPNNIAYSSDSTGLYQFFIESIGDTLKPAFLANYWQSNPAYHLITGAASNVDFGIYVPPGIQDLAIDMTERTPFRAWFDSYIDVVVSNLASEKLPAQLTVILDSTLEYQSSAIVPTSIAGDTLTFITDSLSFSEHLNIWIKVQTSLFDTIGTPITCHATVMPVTGDIDPLNNYSTLNTFVVGSFDPNDKKANYDPYFTPLQIQNREEMQYTIRFQNTGNFPADFVRIVDSLSNFADLSTFRLISSSHDVRYEFGQDRVVTFYFDNIQLPPASIDEPNSHGYVKFAIKFFENLPEGTGIENTSYIYFDFNPPIVTNTVSTLIAFPPVNVNVAEIDNSNTVHLFPNPVSDLLNIQLNGDRTNEKLMIVLYDLNGKIVFNSAFPDNKIIIDVNSFANGQYAGKIYSVDLKKAFMFKCIVMH